MLTITTRSCGCANFIAATDEALRRLALFKIFDAHFRLLLLREGYPAVAVPPEDCKEYLAALAHLSIQGYTSPELFAQAA
jgi:hypothetical protein